jgi:hypothetical protein
MCRGPCNVEVCQRSPSSQQQQPDEVNKLEAAMTGPAQRPRRLPHRALAATFVTASVVALSALQNGKVLSEISRLTQQTTTPHEHDIEAGLHVVISHCSVPLDWIFEQYLVGVPSKSVTIYTKCGRPLFSNPSIKLPNRTLMHIETMPNVGRCDHSYAFWIQQMLQRVQDEDEPHGMYHPDDHVLFMKDNDNMKRHNEGKEEHRSLEEMRIVTTKRGFDCGSRYRAHGFSGVGTNYADKQVLGRFRLKSYKTASKTNARDPFEATFRPLSLWTEMMPVNVTFTTSGIVEVCLGGVFMSTIQRIVDSPVNDWGTIVTALSRGDNIEEGHYMERLWAGLLAPPISLEKQNQLLAAKTGIKPRNGFLGFIFVRKDSPFLNEDDLILQGDDCSTVACGTFFEDQ